MVEPAVALVSVVKWADATTVEHPDTDIIVLCIETAPMELTMMDEENGADGRAREMTVFVEWSLVALKRTIYRLQFPVRKG